MCSHLGSHSQSELHGHFHERHFVYGFCNDEEVRFDEGGED